jgi:hypothetical protein
MSKTVYGVGDCIFLINSPLRTSRPEGEFQIVARLPDTNGQAQYRVQSKSETFERRIVATDIDVERSQIPRAASDHGAKKADAKGSWLTASKIRVHK